jgi:hypothetical protein
MQANTVSAAMTGLGAIAFSATLLAACEPDASKTVSNERVAEEARLTAPTLDESIEAVVRRHYPGGLPYAEIRRFGLAAPPRLRAMLNNAAEKEYWPNIAGAIGIIGGPGASDALIGYIDASRDRSLEPDAYRAALTAVAALGYVANGGDARAMSFIADAARRTNEPSPHTDSLRLSPSAIGVQAILALGLSGLPEARVALEEMQRSGDDAMRERTAESLRTLEHVAKVGLAGYFKRN